MNTPKLKIGTKLIGKASSGVHYKSKAVYLGNGKVKITTGKYKNWLFTSLPGGLTKWFKEVKTKTKSNATRR